MTLDRTSRSIVTKRDTANDQYSKGSYMTDDQIVGKLEHCVQELEKVAGNSRVGEQLTREVEALVQQAKEITKRVRGRNDA